MVKVTLINPDYGKFSPENLGFIPALEFDSNGALNVGLMWGWDTDSNQWTPIALDSSGKIRITSNEGSVSSTNASTVACSTSNAVALSANADRRQFIMRNKGSVDIHFSFSDNDATTSDFLLKAGEVFIETEWRGEVNLITAAGTTDVDILEYID